MGGKKKEQRRSKGEKKLFNIKETQEVRRKQVNERINKKKSERTKKKKTKNK